MIFIEVAGKQQPCLCPLFPPPPSSLSFCLLSPLLLLFPLPCNLACKMPMIDDDDGGVSRELAKSYVKEALQLSLMMGNEMGAAAAVSC